jgi:hypothetical protein
MNALSSQINGAMSSVLLNSQAISTQASAAAGVSAMVGVHHSQIDSLSQMLSSHESAIASLAAAQATRCSSNLSALATNATITYVQSLSQPCVIDMQTALMQEARAH